MSGELLCALGRDSNNQMYPVAWAVMDKENNENWDWFCDLLSRDIKFEVMKWAPEAEHRNCARHIYANWKKEFNDKKWQKMFWACAKAPNQVLFNRTRAKLAQKTRAGAQAILNTHPQHWSLAWFSLGTAMQYAMVQTNLSIYFKTNSLDVYIADCYTVEKFMKIYGHCLEPVEGMHSWPILDRSKLRAPGYIKMPGRPKTERMREPHEKPKSKKMSRMRTVIRCSKCKGVGHNRASCGKNQSVNAVPDQSAQGSQDANQSVAGSQMVIIPQSDAMPPSNSRKRQHSLTITTTQESIAATSTASKGKKTANPRPQSKAMGRVSTAHGGSATMTINAKSASSAATSSVTVNVTSGKAMAKVSVHDVPKKNSSKQTAGNIPMLMMPPWDSAKL
ncbi:hypothetical protein U9M48_005836 [Paspalum notatum var. saurae]|uniref:Uncharacterized protein n=1 Tax=Paspalum notatum var. saurae TaxID=547442 RepID=A0AAQ3SFQ5_PASNO